MEYSAGCRSQVCLTVPVISNKYLSSFPLQPLNLLNMTITILVSPVASPSPWGLGGQGTLLLSCPVTISQTCLCTRARAGGEISPSQPPTYPVCHIKITVIFNRKLLLYECFESTNLVAFMDLQGHPDRIQEDWVKFLLR